MSKIVRGEKIGDEEQFIENELELKYYPSCKKEKKNRNYVPIMAYI